MELKNLVESMRDLADSIDEYSDNIKSLCEAFNKKNIQELTTLRGDRSQYTKGYTSHFTCCKANLRCFAR